MTRALAKPAPLETRTLTEVSLDRVAIAAGRAKLEQDLAEFRALEIEDADTALALGEILIERLREFDLAEAYRKKYTTPAHTTWKNLCELLSTDTYKQICSVIKDKIGAWELKLDRERQAAQSAARAALVQGDVQALTANLQIVNAPEVQAAGVSSRFVWQVKRIAPDLLPDQYWVPDREAIQAEANRQGTRNDDPPVIPGVVFEKAALISGRRN